MKKQQTGAVVQVKPPQLDKLLTWMEETGASLEVSAIGSNYIVYVKWGKLHSYSDTRGRHMETWQVSREGRDLFVVQAEALRVAFAIYRGEEP